MRTPSIEGVFAKTEINVFDLPEAELERLAILLDCELLKCGADERTHLVRYYPPHANIKICYFSKHED
jgi:hypothetical protein